jgi:phosphoheptose isomerase
MQNKGIREMIANLRDSRVSAADELLNRFSLLDDRSPQSSSLSAIIVDLISAGEDIGYIHIHFHYVSAKKQTGNFFFALFLKNG